MTLDAPGRRRTADELHRNLVLSGLDEQAVADELGLPLPRLLAALHVEGADPSDVWVLRDHLEQAVLDAGATPVAHTILTERARTAAQGWFTLRTSPRRAAAARGLAAQRDGARS